MPLSSKGGQAVAFIILLSSGYYIPPYFLKLNYVPRIPHYKKARPDRRAGC